MGLLGVVAPLVFVGLELRQSRIAARATAYQELGIVVASNWMDRANNGKRNDPVFLAMTADSATWADVASSSSACGRKSGRP